MSNEELAAKITMLENKINYAQFTAQEQQAALYLETQNNKKMIEQAVSTIIHKLIEFLKQQDIQALDEETFAKEVHTLLFTEEVLPF